jgi:outer membrane scaffolding protein for murein synthesis (MipA/OmpV family)
MAAFHRAAASRTVSVLAVASALLIASSGVEAAGPDLPQVSVPDGARITVGASAITAPLFEGSARYGVWAVPNIKFEALGGGEGGGGTGILGALKSFDARSIDDISVGVLKFGDFEMGPLAGYRIGRLEKDSPRLRGFGDIEGGLVAGGYARYDVKPFYGRLSLHQHVTGDDTGLIVRFAVGSEIPVTSKVVFKADAFLDYADDTYMNAYFGVTAAQSARSGLRMFDPGAGFKSAGFMIGTDVMVMPLWTLTASAGYSRLLGDSASSPIVETPDRLEARLGLARSFDLRW